MKMRLTVSGLVSGIREGKFAAKLCADRARRSLLLPTLHIANSLAYFLFSQRQDFEISGGPRSFGKAQGPRSLDSGSRAPIRSASPERAGPNKFGFARALRKTKLQRATVGHPATRPRQVTVTALQARAAAAETPGPRAGVKLNRGAS